MNSSYFISSRGRFGLVTGVLLINLGQLGHLELHLVDASTCTANLIRIGVYI